MQNFGKINYAFSEILIDGVLKKSEIHKKLYQSYVKALKDNRVLRTQYLVYKNLETKTEPDLNKAVEYVNENISLLKTFSKKEIHEANKKLVELLGKSKKLLEKKYDEKLEKLHENISFLISKKPSPTNIDAIINVKNQIAEHIIVTKTKEKLSEATVPTKVLCDIALRKFNEKYSDLSENEKSLIKVIIESDNENQSIFFKNTKNKCIDLVNENLKSADTNTKEKLLEVKEKLLCMEYVPDTFSENVIKLINLANDLTE